MVKIKIMMSCLATSVVLSLAVAGAAGAETVINVNATGMAVIKSENTDLADGSIVQMFSSTFVWTQNDGDRAGQSVGGTCHGEARVNGDGVYLGASAR